MQIENKIDKNREIQNIKTIYQINSRKKNMRTYLFSILFVLIGCSLFIRNIFYKNSTYILVGLGIIFLALFVLLISFLGNKIKLKKMIKKKLVDYVLIDVINKTYIFNEDKFIIEINNGIENVINEFTINEIETAFYVTNEKSFVLRINKDFKNHIYVCINEAQNLRSYLRSKKINVYPITLKGEKRNDK